MTETVKRQTCWLPWNKLISLTRSLPITRSHACASFFQVEKIKLKKKELWAHISDTFDLNLPCVKNLVLNYFDGHLISVPPKTIRIINFLVLWIHKIVCLFAGRYAHGITCFQTIKAITSKTSRTGKWGRRWLWRRLREWCQWGMRKVALYTALKHHPSC